MIKDKITKGNVLKTILLDEKKSITLRYIKIKSILAAVDSWKKKIWNDENAVRNKRFSFLKKCIETIFSKKCVIKILDINIEKKKTGMDIDYDNKRSY